MSSTYSSQVQEIKHNLETVYSKLANWETFKPLITNDAFKAALNQNKEFNVSNVQLDNNGCSFKLNNQLEVNVKIIEREPNKTVKLAIKAMGLDSNGWIQLLPISNCNCKLKLTATLPVNTMMKFLIGNKIEKGLNQVANLLANLPYHNL